MGLAAPAGRGRPGRQRLHAGCATSSRRVGWGVRGHVAQWRPQTRGLLGCGGIELRPFPTHTCFRRLPDPDVAKAGTKLSRGANFRCLMSDSPIAGDYIRAEGQAKQMGARLMAVVANGDLQSAPETRRFRRLGGPGRAMQSHS